VTLVIRHPTGWEPERHYTFDVVLRELLGIGFRAEPCEGLATVLIVDGDESRSIRIPDRLFAQKADGRLSTSMLPPEPVPVLSIPDMFHGGALDAGFPALYACEAATAAADKASNGAIQLHFDAFGAVFYLLSRMEEYLTNHGDQHDRFPVEASIAYRNDFLRRPLVNEYAELLRGCLQSIGLRVPENQHRYSASVSHDVDIPFASLRFGWRATVRSVVADVIKRRDLHLAMRRASSKCAAADHALERDPFNSFGFIMDTSESFSLRSAFNFLAERPAGRLDCDYELDDPAILDLLRTITRRGHEIGLHGSYRAYNDAEQFEREACRLRNVLGQIGAEATRLGGRQHYLRWRNPDTWAIWDSQGMAYDSTVGYPDRCGFRAGVCRDYPAFDLANRRRLQLREQPLIAMELAAFRESDNGGEDALDIITSLSNQCRRFAGTFTLLWHNDRLASRKSRDLYSTVLRAIV